MFLIIIATLISILVILMVIYSVYDKNRVLKKLESEYGQKSLRVYDERDYKGISQLFRCFPFVGKEIVDDVTFNDLQLKTLFEHMNHSITNIGDAYVYRHIRTQQYDHLNRLERNILYFDTHPNERLKLQYRLFRSKPPLIMDKDGRAIETGVDTFAEDLKNDAFPKLSLVPCIVFFSGALLLLMLVFLNLQFGTYVQAYQDMIILFLILGASIQLVATLAYFFIYYEKTMSIMKTINTLGGSIHVAKYLNKLDQAFFDEEFEKLSPALEKLKQSSSIFELYKLCMFQTATSLFSLILGFVLVYFGIYGFVYRLVVHTFRRHVNEALVLYDTIGYFELCMSQSSYRNTLSNFCHPTFTNESGFDFQDMYHPLLKEPVSNSKHLEERMIITGANASGKSTFAKALAINILLAQTINLCFAKTFSFNPLTVYTSMKMEDDIASGDSFYVAEIKRLKSFIDSIEPTSRKMFFADEILKGTNTVERIAAATAILKQFAEDQCAFCLTTHDIELTKLLKYDFVNYHFKEITTNQEIRYDYKLYDGVTQASNAIALLEYIHFDSTIVKEASRLAKHFIDFGRWEA